MTDYFTSDLRLGDPEAAHARGFGRNLTAHNASIIHGLINDLSPKGRLFVLGDLTAGIDHGAEQPLVAELARILRAHDISLRLILGDADAAHPMNGRASRRYANNYTDAANGAVSQTDMMTIAGVDVMLNHFSYDTVDQTSEQWSLRDCGVPLLHGDPGGMFRSSPTEPVMRSTATNALQVNVSLDTWGMHPVSKSAVDNLIRNHLKN